MPRFITKQIHAYLDYPVAFGLIIMPFLPGLGHRMSWRLGCRSQPASQR